MSREAAGRREASGERIVRRPPAAQPVAVFFSGAELGQGRSAVNGHPLSSGRITCVALLASCLLVACSAIQGVVGGGAPQTAEVLDQPDAEEYVLVRNPRYSPAATQVSAYEPEYVWVKRKDAPFNLNAFIRGKKVAEAAPRDEERFASTRPPEAVKPPRPDDRFFLPPPAQKKAAPDAKRPDSPSRDPAARLRPAYGYVVLSRGKQVYTDLTSENGAAVGDTLVIYREGEELRHPVTGASLGAADQQVARARITEVRDKVTVAELASALEGDEVRPGDRVKLIPPGVGAGTSRK